jgi:hypothetical protein
MTEDLRAATSSSISAPQLAALMTSTNIQTRNLEFASQLAASSIAILKKCP